MSQADKPSVQGLTAMDYEEVLADRQRLVRRLDVALNGEAGAARQASLCDIVSQVERLASQSAARSFSDFIRNATPQEKEALYSDVMGRAAARQQETIDAAEELPPIVPVALVESVAKAIYKQWVAAPGYVAWVEGGNSLNQDDARSIAREAIAAVEFAAPPSPVLLEVLEALTAFENYMAAVEQMLIAMQDGSNVHGAESALVGCEGNANAAIAKLRELMGEKG